MPKTGCNLHKVARQAGVILVDASENRSSGRPAGLCSCKATARSTAKLTYGS